MTKVIIVGGDHHNTLGVVRSLGIRGINPDVYVISDTTHIYNLHSKYLGTVKSFKTGEDLVEYMISEQDTYSTEPIVLVTSDLAIYHLDKNYSKLSKKYKMFNAHGKLHTIMSKENMCELAKEVGLNIPEHIVHTIGDKLPNTIKFPCITKAISSVDGGKSDTTICQTRKELEDFLKRPDLCHTIQIETFIEKQIEFQFIGLSLNGGEEIVIPGHSHIDRPNGIQNTYYFPYIENDLSFNNTLSMAKKFVKEVGYSGLFSIEFLRGLDGIDYFLEMNFRNDGNAICVTDAGYNLPYIWYLYNIGSDYKKEIEQSVFRPVNYCPEIFYAKQCAYGEVSAYKWLKDMLKADSFTNYYKGDSSRFYWLCFSKFAVKQMIKKLLIKIGVMHAPKESLG